MLTNAGKQALLQHILDSVVHFAFGEGDAVWGAAATHTEDAPADGIITVPHTNITDVVVTNLTTDSVGVKGSAEDPQEYFVVLNTGEIRMFAPFFTEGDEIEVTYRHGANAMTGEETALLDKKLNKLCLDKFFVVEDEEGEVVVDGAAYSVSEVPTDKLYLGVWLEYNEFPNGTVREVGVMLNPTTDPTLDEGVLAFEPEQVLTEGVLLRLRNYPTIYRNLATRVRFNFILTIQ